MTAPHVWFNFGHDNMYGRYMLCLYFIKRKNPQMGEYVHKYRFEWMPFFCRSVYEMQDGYSWLQHCYVKIFGRVEPHWFVKE